VVACWWLEPKALREWKEEGADGKRIDRRFPFLDVACSMPWQEIMRIGPPSAEQPGT
jgi:hypothetical protein